MSNEVGPSAPHDFHSQAPFVNISSLILLTFIPPASKLKKSISALASNGSRNTAEFPCFILNFIYIFHFIYLWTRSRGSSAEISFFLSFILSFFPLSLSAYLSIFRAFPQIITEASVILWPIFSIFSLALKCAVWK